MAIYLRVAVRIYATKIVHGALYDGILLPSNLSLSFCVALKTSILANVLIDFGVCSVNSLWKADYNNLNLCQLS